MKSENKLDYPMAYDACGAQGMVLEAAAVLEDPGLTNLHR